MSDKTCGDPPAASSPDGVRAWNGAPGSPVPYNTMVNYGCAAGKRLQTDDGILVASVRYTCGWKGAWSPDEAVPACVAHECVDPPRPPSENHVVAKAFSAALDDAVAYRCEAGYTDVKGHPGNRLCSN